MRTKNKLSIMHYGKFPKEIRFYFFLKIPHVALVVMFVLVFIIVSILGFIL